MNAPAPTPLCTQTHGSIPHPLHRKLRQDSRGFACCHPRHVARCLAQGVRHWRVGGLGQHRERARNTTVDGVGRAREGRQSTEHPCGRREKVRLRRVRWRQGQRARSASSSERLRRGRPRWGDSHCRAAWHVAAGAESGGDDRKEATGRARAGCQDQGWRGGVGGRTGYLGYRCRQHPVRDTASECGLPCILAGRGGRRGSTWEGGAKLCLGCTELVDPVHLRCFSPPRPLCALPRSPLHGQQ